MSLIISNWLGRTSNNILQIIRAINYAYINKYNHIVLPNHRLLNNNEINIDIDCLNNNINFKNTFFYSKELNLDDPCPKLMKDYFNKYIKPILKLKFSNIIDKNNDNDLYIHIRSGDCFTMNAHKMYVPPPFSYYTKIIDNKSWNKIIVVYEDDRNPCVNLLKKKYSNIFFISSSLENDLNMLSNCKNLVIGFGTFGLLIYFISNNIKNLYIPDYAYNEMPQGDWDINLNIVNLPNYIKCGEWEISNENLDKLINYK